MTLAFSCTSDCFNRPPARKTTQKPDFHLKKTPQSAGKKTHNEPNSRVWASLWVTQIPRTAATLLATAPLQPASCHSTKAVVEAVHSTFPTTSAPCTQRGMENRLHGGAWFGKQSTGGTSSNVNNLSALAGVTLCHGERYLGGKLLM